VAALVYLVFLVDQADVDGTISDFRVHGKGARQRTCLPVKPPAARPVARGLAVAFAIEGGPIRIADVGGPDRESVGEVGRWLTPY